jgi:hypothetical protein
MAARRQLDALHEIPLGEGPPAYALVLRKPFVAIIDPRGATIAPDTLLAGPHLVLAVYDRVLPSGRWPRIGAVAGASTQIAIPEQFIQDVVTGACRILGAGGVARAATVDECAGLEAAAVWDAEHVEGRLRAARAGTIDPHIAHLAPKRR